MRAAWPERVSQDGSGAEKGVGKGLSLWRIWPLPRSPREDPEPHQLGGILSLLSAEDERELLQPMPELLTRGELAPDEGQWPQLEHPVKEQRWMGLQLPLGLSCLPGSKGCLSVTNTPHYAHRKPRSAGVPGGTKHRWSHCERSRAGTQVGGPK